MQYSKTFNTTGLPTNSDCSEIVTSQSPGTHVFGFW